MNLTSKVLVSNLEEHHIDKDNVLHATYNPQKAHKKGNINGVGGKVRKVIAGKRKNKNESKNWRSPKTTYES